MALDHKAPQNVTNIADNNARDMWWLEYLAVFDYAHKYRKDSANSKCEFLSRLPQLVTEHDRNGSDRPPPDDGEAIYHSRPCGVRGCLRSYPPLYIGGLMPQPDSPSSGSFPTTSTDIREFLTHGPRIGVDDRSASSASFATRVFASFFTGDGRLRHAAFRANLQRRPHSFSSTLFLGLIHKYHTRELLHPLRTPAWQCEIFTTCEN